MTDVCAIGNALVDILVACDDAFLSTHKVAKGGMTLVDDARATALYQAAGGKGALASGGSAGNTVAGLASLGGSCAYLGKVGRDAFGEAFAQDMRGQSIAFTGQPSGDLATGRCVVLVTPDAERSMNTFLGAAAAFGPGDVDAATVQSAAVTYLEGFLFDKPPAQDAFRRAATIVRQAGRKLSLSLSDSFCVHRHRAAFHALIRDEVDILFANEDELKALYETQDFAAALAAVRADAAIAVITRGAAGSVIVQGEAVHTVAAATPPQIVDTTGAGDLYAAGVLYGLTRGMDLPACGRIGALAATEVISHVGPRPLVRLATFL